MAAVATSATKHVNGTAASPRPVAGMQAVVPLDRYVADAPAEYRRLVVDSARNGTVPGMTAAVHSLLSVVGRTPSQLLSDIQRVKGRFAAAQARDAAEARRPELEAASARTTEAKLGRVKMHEEHAAALAEQQREIDAALTAEIRIRSEVERPASEGLTVLVSTSDPEIDDEIARLRESAERHRHEATPNGFTDDLEQRLKKAAREAESHYWRNHVVETENPNAANKQQRDCEQEKSDARMAAQSAYVAEHIAEAERLESEATAMQRAKLDPERFALVK